MKPPECWKCMGEGIHCWTCGEIESVCGCHEPNVGECEECDGTGEQQKVKP